MADGTARRALPLLALLLAAPVLAGRRDTVPLDGQWEFRFAPDDRGTSAKWFDAGVPFARRIAVPGSWDAQGVGVPTDKMRHNAIGVGWYRRALPIPGGWRGKHVWLVVGGAHRSARVWVNGKTVGEHLGYPTAARFEITGALSASGPQWLVLAVDSRRDADRDPLVGAFDVIDYMDLTWGGIFEHVWLEATEGQWIDDAFVKPDPARRSASVEVSVGRSSTADAPGMQLAYAVRSAGRAGDEPPPYRDAGPSGVHERKGAADVTGSACQLRLPLAGFPTWSPTSPNLITLDLILVRGGSVIDRYSVRFGLRRLEIHGAGFRLNGDPFYLRGYGDDYTFPLTIAAPADVDFWRGYLRRRREFGFNGVRHHSTMPSESYLAAADEVGMFVQPELPIAYSPFFDAATPTGRKLYSQVWGDYIRQMRNHPSVFAWCMGNEQYGGFALGPELYDLAKALDPTRPVIDTDGVPWGTGRRTLDYGSVQFDEFDAGAVAWGANRGKYNPGPATRPVVVHEMSNISTLPDPADIPRYSGVIRPFWLEQMRDAVRRQHLEGRLPEMLRASQRLQASLLKLNLEAARLSPAISGHYQWLFRDYWTQSTGFVNQFDETRALTPEMSRQFLADAVLLWDRDRCNYRAGEAIPLQVFLSDFRPFGGAPLREVRARLGSAEVTLAPPTKPPRRGLIGPWTGSLAAPKVAEPRELALQVWAAQGVHNSWPVWVFPRAPAPDPAALVRPRLTRGLLDRVDRGAHLLITDDSTVFPSTSASFKPAWWKGDDNSDHCYGNLFAEHPALLGFPADGYGDLQAFGLLDRRPVALTDDIPGQPEPIIWSVDVPWRMRRMAYLFEARVGNGCLMVSTMNLSPRLRGDDPAAAWMLSCLTRYLAGPACKPASRIPVAWLRDRLQQVQLPAPATWVEGFSAAVDSTEAPQPWYSYREDNVATYPVRQTDGRQRLTWRTAPVPASWPHRTVTFVWAGGIGWRSQPDGGHFSVSVNGALALDFAFTTQTARWRSSDGTVSLDYVVRRSTSEDTFGLFYLSVPADRLQPGKPAELAVTATAQNSRRWFSVVPYTDVVASERDDD